MNLGRLDPAALAWDKGKGLLPAIVQHADSGAVLMLGYMNEAALRETQRRGQVVFYSRSRQQLWLKGETSGNVLELIDLHVDCDADALLVRARPAGPVCHRGTPTCFAAEAQPDFAFLAELEHVIAARLRDQPDGSYTAALAAGGTARAAQKVGEEGVELALAGAAAQREPVLLESADLLFHVLLLLRLHDVRLADVVAELRSRHRTTAPRACKD